MNRDLELEELFDFKTMQIKIRKSPVPIASSLNLLLSGGQNKGIGFRDKDEVVLKKWLHNWIYTLDKKFRLDPMSVSKQQHLDFEEMFRSRKMKN